ncbi:MAG TPA: aminotransferase, partial [Clostridia bacterium]|nr:aminotransferase [Clostridia bacterium]
MIKVYIEKTRKDAKIPVYANSFDAGADVCACEDAVLDINSTRVIPTGLKVAIPEGYEIQIRPRSGLSLNTRLRVANSPGTIDAGYRDEIGII